jgi:hypothetical protein
MGNKGFFVGTVLLLLFLVAFHCFFQVVLAARDSSSTTIICDLSVFFIGVSLAFAGNISAQLFLTK